jgi:glycosyltransferase involved in cell wall biosynthesis
MPTALSIAYPFASVNADAAGGAEQVLRMIDEALLRAGWRSIVIAQEGSRVGGSLIPVPAFERIGNSERGSAYQMVREAISRALAWETIDIVHLHGIDFPKYIPPTGPPILATLHLPPEWYSREAFIPLRPNAFLNAVSLSQYRQCPPSPAILGVIENGVDIEGYPSAGARDGFALAIGRICPEKGFHLAIEACIKAECDFILGGRVFAYEEHERYFRDEIWPRLDSSRRFIGPVGRMLKADLLSRARCVLVPSLAAETSSLIAMEAMACGTAVIAFAAGALPEIVTDGKTGFVVRDVDEMATAIGRAHQIDSMECRAEAARRFRASRMTNAYIELYAKIINGGASAS